MNFWKTFERLLKKEPKVEAHEHNWELQYRTGNPINGKSEVYKCACGQHAVRHYGQKDKILID